MRSNNPVFNNSPAFNGQGGYVQQSYQQGAYPPPPPGYAPQAPQYGGPQMATRALTIDDVVQKTGLTLVVLVFAAAATWILSGDVTVPANASKLTMLTGIGAIGGLVVGLICSFKRAMLSPALVLAYAALQGMFMGGVSKIYELNYGNGIVLQAVAGTIAASAGMLAAYKFLGIKVNDQFRKGFCAAALGFLGLGLLEFVLSMIGHPMGLFGNGGAGFLFAAVGLAFGVVGLVLDFDMVEHGIRSGVPEKFAWTAAFGLTASLVMVYFYLLRLLSILRD